MRAALSGSQPLMASITTSGTPRIRARSRRCGERHGDGGPGGDPAAVETLDDTDAEYLQTPVWPEVVAIAGRLAQVMVANDLRELAVLLDEEAVPDPCQVVRGTTGNSGDRGDGRASSDTASSQFSPAAFPEHR